MADFSFPITELDTWIGLLTLTLMEIVLGIDNVIFISIIVSKLPQALQAKARVIGLGLAFLFRIVLLFAITWVIGLVQPLFTVLSHSVSGRDLILIGGGLFLLLKSTLEIHHKLEGDPEGDVKKAAAAVMWKAVVQIALLDLVFSFDSVITAVGLVKHIPVMIIAVVISMIIMLVFAKAISGIIERHPTIKILALSFLLMIGTMLVAEGMHFHIARGYIYFAMAFSLFVELLNIRVRRMHKAA